MAGIQHLLRIAFYNIDVCVCKLRVTGQGPSVPIKTEHTFSSFFKPLYKSQNLFKYPITECY